MTATASKYRQEYVRLLHDYMRVEGDKATIVGFARSIGVSRGALSNWSRSHLGFGAALDGLRSLRLKSSLVPGFAGKFPRRIVGWKP